MPIKSDRFFRARGSASHGDVTSNSDSHAVLSASEYRGDISFARPGVVRSTCVYVCNCLSDSRRLGENASLKGGLVTAVFLSTKEATHTIKGKELY